MVEKSPEPDVLTIRAFDNEARAPKAIVLPADCGGARIFMIKQDGTTLVYNPRTGFWDSEDDTALRESLG